MKTCIWIACLVAALAACAPRPPSDYCPRLQTEVEALRERYDFPGMTAAFVRSDGAGGWAAAGLADAETGAPMRADSRMLAASIGKSFVGAVCIALHQEGRLSLDAHLSRWLAAYDWFERLPNHDTMTLRHVLTHSAGLPDHVYMAGFAEALAAAWREPDNPFPPEKLVAFVLDQPPLFPAGQGWSYSDTGYILAGLVVEAVTGRRVYEVIRERFLVPLALASTSPSDRRDLVGLAAGYIHPNNPFGFPAKTLDDRGYLRWHPAVEWTGGGLISSSPDLARWGAALFSGKALGDDAVGELLTTVAVDPEDSAMGYGLGVGVADGGRLGPVYGHAGWIPGYLSSLRHYPDHGLTVAFQINTDIGVIDGNEHVLAIIEQRLAETVIGVER